MEICCHSDGARLVLSPYLMACAGIPAGRLLMKRAPGPDWHPWTRGFGTERGKVAAAVDSYWPREMGRMASGASAAAVVVGQH